MSAPNVKKRTRETLESMKDTLTELWPMAKKLAADLETHIKEMDAEAAKEKDKEDEVVVLSAEEEAAVSAAEKVVKVLKAVDSEVKKEVVVLA